MRLTTVFLLSYFAFPLFAQPPLESSNLPHFYYLKGEFRQSLKEIESLEVSQNFESIEDDYYLLKLLNLYHLGEWDKILAFKEDNLSSPQNKIYLKYYKGISAVKNNQIELANRFFEDDFEALKIKLDNSAKIDPQKAANMSRYFPGSGFLLSGEYFKFGVSLTLNLSFFYGAAYFFSQERYALSFLFLFFNYQWYRGGINGSIESSENYNKLLDEKSTSAWLQKMEAKIAKIQYKFN